MALRCKSLILALVYYSPLSESLRVLRCQDFEALVQFAHWIEIMAGEETQENHQSFEHHEIISVALVERYRSIVPFPKPLESDEFWIQDFSDVMEVIWVIYCTLDDTIIGVWGSTPQTHKPFCNLMHYLEYKFYILYSIIYVFWNLYFCRSHSICGFMWVQIGFAVKWVLIRSGIGPKLVVQNFPSVKLLNLGISKKLCAFTILLLLLFLKGGSLFESFH